MQMRTFQRHIYVYILRDFNYIMYHVGFPIKMFCYDDDNNCCYNGWIPGYHNSSAVKNNIHIIRY